MLTLSSKHHIWSTKAFQTIFGRRHSPPTICQELSLLSISSYFSLIFCLVKFPSWKRRPSPKIRVKFFFIRPGPDFGQRLQSLHIFTQMWIKSAHVMLYYNVAIRKRLQTPKNRAVIALVELSPSAPVAKSIAAIVTRHSLIFWQLLKRVVKSLERSDCLQICWIVGVKWRSEIWNAWKRNTRVESKTPNYLKV